MEQLIVLGTGNAVAVNYYNTCFLLKNDHKYFLVDTGGGNGILKQLLEADVDYREIHDIFITHEHSDHVLGIVWMIRVIATAMVKGEYDGDCRIYCHSDLVETIRTISRLTVQGKFFKMVDDRIKFVPLKDQQEECIIGYQVQFFDIHSTKAKQYGFTTVLTNGKKLTCLGDEPFNEANREVVKGSQWLLHEAFCLYSQQDIFKPYEKNHSTVKDACELANELKIDHLVLWHSEDQSYPHRKELYMQEGKPCYDGDLYVPEDLEIIEL